MNLETYSEEIELFDDFVMKEPQEKAAYYLQKICKDFHDLIDIEKLATNHGVSKRQALQAFLTSKSAEPYFTPTQHSLLDALLCLETKERTLIKASHLETKTRFGDTNISLWQGDITTLEVDAIVNAANSQMEGCFQPFHRCIDNAIHAVAGPRLREDCHRVMKQQGHLEKTGTAKITRAYHLPSSFVLHTVGPIVPRGTELQPLQKEQLSKCYQACLELAAETKKIDSLAFCCISTGVFGFPPDQACNIALETVSKWCQENPGSLKQVVFNVFSKEDDERYNRALSNEEEGSWRK